MGATIRHNSRLTVLPSEFLRLLRRNGQQQGKDLFRNGEKEENAFQVSSAAAAAGDQLFHGQVSLVMEFLLFLYYR